MEKATKYEVGKILWGGERPTATAPTGLRMKKYRCAMGHEYAAAADISMAVTMGDKAITRAVCLFCWLENLPAVEEVKETI